MSLFVLAIEYMLLHTIFESIRDKDYDYEEYESLRHKSQNNLNNWQPLSDNQLEYIRKLTEN